MLTVMRIAIAGVLLVAGSAVADDHRPAAWTFRATPGFGYAWDRPMLCPAEGIAMSGGWYIGKFVTPSLAVGGGLGMDVVGSRPQTCSYANEGVFYMAGTLGPYVEWYPLDRGLHARVLAGAASLDHQHPYGDIEVYGIGGTAAVGYDWTARNPKGDGDFRFGAEVEVTVLRTAGHHATLMPALTMTIGVD
jgi:hypothetical protein